MKRFEEQIAFSETKLKQTSSNNFQILNPTTVKKTMAIHKEK